MYLSKSSGIWHVPFNVFMVELCSCVVKKQKCLSLHRFGLQKVFNCGMTCLFPCSCFCFSSLFGFFKYVLLSLVLKHTLTGVQSIIIISSFSTAYS